MERWFKAQKEEKRFWIRISDIKSRPEKNRFQTLISKFKEFIPDTSKSNIILDVGCGPDGLIFYYPKTETKIGIDPLMDSYILHYNIRGKNFLIKGVGEYLPFKDNGVDIIFCINTLDHTRHPWQVLKEIFRVLKSGAFFLLDVDTEPFLDKLLICKTNYRPPLNKYHPHKLLPRDVLLNMKNTKFRILKKRTWIPFPWIRGLVQLLLFKKESTRVKIFNISKKSLLQKFLLRSIDLFLYPYAKCWFASGLLILATKEAHN